MVLRSYLVPVLLVLALSLMSLACLLFALDADSADAEEPSSARLLVHLLDYLAKDYPGAVSLGRVLDEGEYREQVEFSATALATSASLPETSGDSEVGPGLRRLRDLVSAKADPGAVSALARAVQAPSSPYRAWRSPRGAGRVSSPARRSSRRTARPATAQADAATARSRPA